MHTPKEETFSHSLTQKTSLPTLFNVSTLLCTLTFSCLSSTLQADTFLGIYAGAGQWFNSYDGSLSSKGPSIDIEADLAFDDESQTFLYVALEHPIPFLPNAKLSRTALQAEASTTLSSAVEFEGSSFTVNTNVNSKIDLSHTDATLYYEILDNWISLDLGLTARLFSGEAAIASTVQSASVEIDEAVPMVYGMAKFELPLTGFYARGEINHTSYKDNSMTDYSLVAGYESPLRFGAELGYRQVSFSLNDIEDLKSDFDTSGFFLALTVHI